jgi:triacylglycerol esterase/lipase EstA (alpha/beta hydrolase family)
MKKLNFLVVILLLLSLSCKKESTETPPQVDNRKFPIVMVHGFLASGDTYEKQMLRFASNGYDLDMLYTFNWNSIGGGTAVQGQLDKFIDEVIAKTGFDQVELVGHSAGSGNVFEYCKSDKKAAKVRHLVLLAGTAQTQAAGTTKTPVKTLNIYSPYDQIVKAGGKIKNATNISLDLKDHYQVATSEETFTEMYKFFTGEMPQTLDIIPQNDPTISGDVLSFGENLTGNGATLEIYEVNTAYR